MPAPDQEFLKRLLATFKVEAQEHVGALFSGLMELEKTPSPQAEAGLIETIYREAHSLKGAARAVNRTEIEFVCQRLEGVFAALKRQDMGLSPALLDLFHSAVDVLSHLVSMLDTEVPPAEQGLADEVGRRLEMALRGPLPSPVAPLPKPSELSAQPLVEEKPSLPDTVRISASRLDSLLLASEELLSAKLAMERHAETIRGMRRSFARWKKERAKIHPVIKNLERSVAPKSVTNGAGNGGADGLRLIEFINWNQTFMDSFESDFVALERPFERNRRALAAMVDNLLDDMKKAAMLPFSSLVDLLRKLVRDLSHAEGKQAQLIVIGADVEMDRRILEGIKDPLIHLVRNSIDHGIEKPEARESKPRMGTVTISLAQKEGGKVELRVADDGAGMDLAKLKAAALEMGLISQTEAEDLSRKGMMTLAFHSGLSTRPVASEISGRGLGLAIVQEKVEALGGSLSIETIPGVGTTFAIILPVTLSSFRGVIVGIADQLFVFPTIHVERSVRIKQQDIKTVENRATIVLDNQAVALVHLSDVLAIAAHNQSGETEDVFCVIVTAAGVRIAFAVDEVLREQEVILKNFSKPLIRVRNIAGATILGSGRVVPVLNVTDLMGAIVQAPQIRAAKLARAQERETRKKILVVEDSITSRTLLKNILESAGYDVETAADGLDGFTKLRSSDFSMVVSDVEMPRMNGFDLTAKIRGEPKYAELPVALVTALESREDRERGVDVGANAYLVKSSFDQSNLLETVRRLI